MDEIEDCDNRDVMIEGIVVCSENTGSSSIKGHDVEEVGRLNTDRCGEEEEDSEDGEVLEIVEQCPSIPPVVECVDILDSDEEFPVCLEQGVNNDCVNMVEREGYIQEYIERQGAGVIFSNECGLVLFHLENVWVNGSRVSLTDTRKRLPTGS